MDCLPILLTPTSIKSTGLNSKKGSCFEYFTKPVSLPDKGTFP